MKPGFGRRLRRAAAGGAGLLRSTALVLALLWLLDRLAVPLALPPEVPVPDGPTIVLYQLDRSGLRDALAAHWLRSPFLVALAAAHLLIDALLLVSAYVLALVLLGRRVGRWAWPQRADRLRALGGAMRYFVPAALLAGTLDLVENTMAALHLGLLHGQAPAGWGLAMTAVSAVRWGLLVGLLAVAAVAALHAALRAQNARVRQALHDGVQGLRAALHLAGLHVYPLLLLAAGLAALGVVPQAQELLLDLVDLPPIESWRWFLDHNKIGQVTSGAAVWLWALTLSLRWVHRARGGDPTTLPLYVHGTLAFAGASGAALVGLVLSTRPTYGVGLLAFCGSYVLWVGLRVAERAARGWQPFVSPMLGPASPAWPLGMRWLLLGSIMVVTHLALGDRAPGWAEILGARQRPDGTWRAYVQTMDAALWQQAAAALGALVWARHAWRRSEQGLSAGLHWLGSLLVWGAGAVSSLGWSAAYVQASMYLLTAAWPAALGVMLHIGRSPLWRRGAERASQVRAPWWLRLPLRAGAFLMVERPQLLPRIMMALLFLGFWGAVTLAPHALVNLFGALPILLVGLSVWCLLLTAVFVAWPVRRGLGNWAALPLLGLLFSGQAGAPTLPADAHAAVPPRTVAEQWQRWPPAPQLTPQAPGFLVAAAGGGLRAAYWTASLLAEMDDRSCGRFGQRVLAASGVSGGSLGVALWAAQRRVWQALPEPERCKPGRRAELQRMLSHDFLAPVVASLLFAEPVRMLAPWAARERGRDEMLAEALARAWDEVFPAPPGHGLLRQPFLQALQATDGEPMLFFNATAVETGQRVVASNLQMLGMPVDPLFHATGVSRGMQLLTGGLSLVDAVLHSARFPLVSPPGAVAACLPGEPPREGRSCGEGSSRIGQGLWVHLVDGGYFENSGIETLKDLRRTLPAGGGGTPLHLIAITNDDSRQTLCAPVAFGAVSAQDAYAVDAANRRLAAPTLRAGDPSSEAGSPLRVLLEVRERRARLELARWAHEFGCTQVREWSLGVALNRGQRQPALGWMLSKRSRELMDAAVVRHAEAFERQARGEFTPREPLRPGPAAGLR